MTDTRKASTKSTADHGRSESVSDYPSLTVGQVAERLHVCEATLFRMLSRGEAPTSYKIGKRRLFRDSDVLEWLERSCRQVAAA